MSNLPHTDHLDLEFDNEWLHIWLNRPASRNALSKEMSDELVAVLNAVRDDRTVRGISLRGRGGIFCAGGDLKAFGALGAMSREEAHAAAVDISRGAATLYAVVKHQPQFTVAVVEGAAMAGGMGLACACDAIIATSEARFALTETRIGLIPAQIAPYVIQRLGYAQARTLMLTGEQFSADRARALGLINDVVPAAADLPAVENRIIAEVLKCEPNAIAATKQVIEGIARHDHDEQIDFAATHFADCLISKEAEEGIASFLEKRQPIWSQPKSRSRSKSSQE